MTSLPQLPPLSWNPLEQSAARTLQYAAKGVPSSWTAPGLGVLGSFFGGTLLRAIFVIGGLVLIIVGFTQFRGPSVVIENAKAAAEKAAVAA